MWCVADLDADHIAKMEDLLALYERPYHVKEPVVCLDEKPVSLHAEVRPPRPTRPGHIAKRDSEHRRCRPAHLRRETRASNTRANRTKTCIRWQFTRRDARIKFGYQQNLYKRSKT